MQRLIFREIGVTSPRPFRRMPYAEAIARYGSDKPDLRFGLEIEDLSDAFGRVRVQRLPRRDRRQGGAVRGVRRPGRRRATRAASSTTLVEQAKQLGAGGPRVGARARRAPSRARP